MKTWDQLEAMAKSDRLRLVRTGFGTTIYTADSFPMPLASIVIDNLEDRDLDSVSRRAVEATLVALKAVES